jgi:hypothetical protein
MEKEDRDMAKGPQSSKYPLYSVLINITTTDDSDHLRHLSAQLIAALKYQFEDGELIQVEDLRKTKRMDGELVKFFQHVFVGKSPPTIEESLDGEPLQPSA